MRCEREGEVKGLLAQGHWPEASGEELRGHVAGCSKCGDLVVVTEAFREAREASMKAAPVGPPGVLWWRAQVRRRQMALEQIERPLLGAQMFALIVTVLIGVGLGLVEMRRGFSWSTGLQALHLDALVPAGRLDMGMLVVGVCVGAVAVLGGLVVYLGVERR